MPENPDFVTAYDTQTNAKLVDQYGDPRPVPIAWVEPGSPFPHLSQVPSEKALHRVFDPDGHTVNEVLAYLADASPAEVARVQLAEADGKGRVTIASFEAPESPESLTATGDAGAENKENY